MGERLKFPAPYFGGKSRVAALVWQRLGDVDNFVEPFCGSAAVLLARPHAPRVETLNDADCHVANVWRSLKWDPEGVAEWADAPVNEACMHAEHRWLVGVPAVPPGIDTPYLRAMYLAGMLGDAPLAFARDAALFRHRVRTDPDYYDAKRAGRWLHGACCWIGSGWCVTPDSAEWEQLPCLSKANGVAAAARLPQQRPQIGGNHDHGRGVNADLPAQLPKLSCADGVPSTPSGAAGLSAQVPRLTNDVALRAGPRADALPLKVPTLGGSAPGGVCGRPQLADAYALGRGVHAGPGPAQKRPILGGGTEAGCSGPPGVIAKSGGGTCAARRAWLLDWFGRLRDRLRCVRVCCGDFLRVMDSESVTTRLGLTGVFVDPPYLTHRADGSLSRAEGLYATDGGKDALVDIRDRLLAYCLERGGDPKMRLCVATYEGDGYEALLSRGWTVEAWRSQGGYSNRNKANKNRDRERLFFSPNCTRGQAGLFDRLEENTENSSESEASGVEDGDGLR